MPASWEIVDKFGGTEGLVSMEHTVEEAVNEIYVEDDDQFKNHERFDCCRERRSLADSPRRLFLLL